MEITLVGPVRKTRKFLPKEMCGNCGDFGAEFIYHEGKIVILWFTEKSNNSMSVLGVIKATDYPTDGELSILEVFDDKTW